MIRWHSEVAPMETRSKMKTSTEEQRLAYSKPSLEHLGLVKVMTLSGSDGPSESAGAGSEMACLPNYKYNSQCDTTP